MKTPLLALYVTIIEGKIPWNLLLESWSISPEFLDIQWRGTPGVWESRTNRHILSGHQGRDCPCQDALHTTYVPGTTDSLCHAAQGLPRTYPKRRASGGHRARSVLAFPTMLPGVERHRSLPQASYILAASWIILLDHTDFITWSTDIGQLSHK